jgi:sugar lactone lactonase YvrE
MATTTTLAGVYLASTFAESTVFGGARFINPLSVAVTSTGTLLVADSGAHRIRAVLPSGATSTLAGSGFAAFSDGVGNAASFSTPSGVAVNASDFAIIADTNNCRIRVVKPSGEVTTLAGSGLPGFADGSATAAQFSFPLSVAIDLSGVVYVADTGNSRVRLVSRVGAVTTLVTFNTSSFWYGPPTGIAIDASGQLFLSVWQSIIAIPPGGTPFPYAGGTTGSFSASLYADGYRLAAYFSSPRGLSLGPDGTLYAHASTACVVFEIPSTHGKNP